MVKLKNLEYFNYVDNEIYLGDGLSEIEKIISKLDRMNMCIVTTSALTDWDWNPEYCKSLTNEQQYVLDLCDSVTEDKGRFYNPYLANLDYSKAIANFPIYIIINKDLEILYMCNSETPLEIAIELVYDNNVNFLVERKLHSCEKPFNHNWVVDVIPEVGSEILIADDVTENIGRFSINGLSYDSYGTVCFDSGNLGRFIVIQSDGYVFIYDMKTRSKVITANNYLSILPVTPNFETCALSDDNELHKLSITEDDEGVLIITETII